jgi:hypothetical protein
VDFSIWTPSESRKNEEQERRNTREEIVQNELVRTYS